MNYDYFSQLESGILVKAEGETEQNFMTRVLSGVISGQESADSTRVNEKLVPVFVSCNAENRSLSVSFIAQEWMLNPNGTLHGGMLSTATDTVLCVLGRYLAKKRTIVTAQLSMNFLRAIQSGDAFTVHAVADHVGSRSVMMRAHITTNHSNKPVATATAVLM